MTLRLLKVAATLFTFRRNAGARRLRTQDAGSAAGRRGKHVNPILRSELRLELVGKIGMISPIHKEMNVRMRAALVVDQLRPQSRYALEHDAQDLPQRGTLGHANHQQVRTDDWPKRAIKGDRHVNCRISFGCAVGCQDRASMFAYAPALPFSTLS